MGLSNKFGWLVLTTGNKSELAVGYSTLYGDTAGGFAVIKDVPKTLVYRLCRWRNTEGEVIPQSVLDKPPTAELRAGPARHRQPARLTSCSTRCSRLTSRATSPPASWSKRALTPTWSQRVVRLVDLAEYKRRQSPLGVRVTPKAFGRDRRMPITNRYR